MSDLGPYLWLIPGLPLLAAAVTALFGPRFLKNQSHWPCILGIAGAFVFAFLVFLHVRDAHGEHAEAVVYSQYTWIEAGRASCQPVAQADNHETLQ